MGFISVLARALVYEYLGFIYRGTLGVDLNQTDFPRGPDSCGI
jgi:hypothetical protein